MADPVIMVWMRLLRAGGTFEKVGRVAGRGSLYLNTEPGRRRKPFDCPRGRTFDYWSCPGHISFCREHDVREVQYRVVTGLDPSK